MSFYNANLEVGEEFVTLSKPGHSEGIVAKILDRSADGNSLVLDRKIHERYTKIEGWTATGFVATELTRTKE